MTLQVEPIQISVFRGSNPPLSQRGFFFSTPKTQICSELIGFLADGFNPFEKYYSNWESSPNTGENKKYLKPPPRLFNQISVEHVVVHPFVNPKKLEIGEPSASLFWSKNSWDLGEVSSSSSLLLQGPGPASFSSIAAFLTQLNSWKSWVLRYLIGSM